MSNEQEIEVLGVLCRLVRTTDGRAEWRGGMSRRDRAKPDEAWEAVRVMRDGDHWTVIRKVSFRDGDPDRWGSGTRLKARFYFEGQGPTLEVAEFQCWCAEEYSERVLKP